MLKRLRRVLVSRLRSSRTVVSHPRVVSDTDPGAASPVQAMAGQAAYRDDRVGRVVVSVQAEQRQGKLARLVVAGVCGDHDLVALGGDVDQVRGVVDCQDLPAEAAAKRQVVPHPGAAVALNRKGSYAGARIAAGGDERSPRAECSSRHPRAPSNAVDEGLESGRICSQVTCEAPLSRLPAAMMVPSGRSSAAAAVTERCRVYTRQPGLSSARGGIEVGPVPNRSA